MPKILSLTLCAALAFPLSLQAQPIRGMGGTYSLTAPWGWVLDARTGQSADSDAVLYPRGTHYKDAPSVIFVTSAPNDEEMTLDEIIRKDLEGTVKQEPKVKVQEGPALFTHQGKRAAVRFFEGFKDGHVEAVVYLSERGFTTVFTLSSYDPKVLQEDLPALQALVSSFEALPGGTEPETAVG